MAAQGWKPGDYLGAENASHAEHYTGASASHIRALLREDNLGLGAQVGKVNAETFGLSLFSGVLGRLNGKSDVEIQKHQNALRDAELRTYQTQKHGHMNFISGGFLVGDRIESSLEEELLSRKIERSNDSDTSDRGKRRVVGTGLSEPSSKKMKSSRNGNSAIVEETYDSQQRPRKAEESGAEIRAKKQKMSKKSQRAKKTADDDDDATTEDDRSRRKQERRARKEERRRQKEDKRRLASSEKSSAATSTQPTEDESAPKNPVATQRADVSTCNRHAVRQRYIQQKRMASMDAQAMKEIFMLGPTATAA